MTTFMTEIGSFYCYFHITFFLQLDIIGPIIMKNSIFLRPTDPFLRPRNP